MSTHPYFDNMHIPPQVAGEVSPTLSGVIVVPCRGENRLFDFLQQLVQTQSDLSQWEVIVLWYASDWDEESVMQENVNQLLHLESFKREHPQLVVHGLSFQHLPHQQVDALAIKLAMDEAAYRLDLACQPQAPIVLWSAPFQLEGDLLQALDQLPAEEQMWLLHTESTVVHKEQYQLELSHLYWQLGLQKAGYPYYFPVRSDLMVCRQSTYLLYQGLVGKECSEIHQLHLKVQRQKQCGYLSGVQAHGPLSASPAILTVAHDDWVPLDWFRDLALFQDRWVQLSQVNKLSDFNQWLLSLPQPFVAYLTDQRFPVAWLALQQGARSLKALERELYSWWSPDRMRQMVEQVVPIYYTCQPPAEAVADLLQWMHAMPSDNWELTYQVETLRLLYQQQVVATKKASPLRARLV